MMINGIQSIVPVITVYERTLSACNIIFLRFFLIVGNQHIIAIKRHPEKSYILRFSGCLFIA